MFGKKKPTEFEKSASININATPQKVFALIDPSSSEYCMRQKGFEVELQPNTKNSYFAHSPDMPADYCALVVNECVPSEHLFINSKRHLVGPSFGYLLGATDRYHLSSLESEVTTLELHSAAEFHPKAKGARLDMEQQIYEESINSHLDSIRSFCELPPQQNKHHPLFHVYEFWQWFVENESPLRSAGVEDTELLVQLGDRLQEANPSLSFEIRALDDDSRELAIHADGMKSAFPAVKQAVAEAPEELLSNWSIVAFKQPKGAFDGMGQIGSDVFDPRTVRYRLEPLNEYGTRDITLFFETYTRRTREQHMGQCFFVLDHCLGEYRTATAIGEIELAAMSKAGADAKPIESLVLEFD